MAATAGYQARVQIGIITDTTARTAYAVTEVSGSGGLIWKGGSERYIWDPATPITVEVDAAPVTTGWTFDYLLGILTFDSDQSGSTITVTGETFDMFTIAQAHSFTLNIMRTMLEDTVFQDTAVSRIYGLKDVNGTVSRFETALADWDSGAGTISAWDTLNSGRVLIIEIRPNLTLDDVFRASVIFESEENSAEVSGLAEAVFSFQGVLLENATTSATFGDPIP